MVNQKSAISTFGHRPNLINCYMENKDRRSITWFTKLTDWRGFKLAWFCSSIFLQLAKINRQVSLPHFDLKLPFCACPASNSSKHHQQEKGNSFSLPQLSQGRHDRALSFLRLMNTLLAIHHYVRGSLNAPETNLQQDKMYLQPEVVRQKIAKQRVATAYHCSFTLTLCNFSLQPSHRQLLPMERKACE